MILNSQAKHGCRKCGAWKMVPDEDTGSMKCVVCGTAMRNAKYHKDTESFINAVQEQIGKRIDSEVDGLLDKVIEQSESDDTPIDEWADKLARDFAQQPEDDADE